MKKVTVYLNDQKHMELKMLCVQLQISMNNFMQLAIKDRIKETIKKARKLNGKH